MKLLKFLLVGILFGIVMTKSEAISWYRIQEMFRFQSFHMYGIIGVAVVLGVLMRQWMQRSGFQNTEGEVVQIKPKDKNYIAAIGGGILFGLGWAMTGACPGPLYVLVGNGFLVVLVIIGAALIGTLCYGALKNKLPH